MQKVNNSVSHKKRKKITYSVSFGVSVLKAPVWTLLIVTAVDVLVEVLVEVIVGSSSEILLNDMAMLETIWVNTTENEEKKNKKLEPEMEGKGLAIDVRTTEVLI